MLWKAYTKEGCSLKGIHFFFEKVIAHLNLSQECSSQRF
jgi:hypothetical protein